MNTLIKTISYDQTEIIQNIIKLHCPKGIELDPTYSKGNFYKKIDPPKLKFDLFPQRKDVLCASAENLPLGGNSISSMMFDPPFLAGHTRNGIPSGIITKRFTAFRYMSDLWAWYDLCLLEFHRVLTKKGILIFKCQDTVSSGKQWWSHVHIMNKAKEAGFYCKDLFILLAKSRMIGHNHKKQYHARKFHSYFLVFVKRN